ncbi:hypothetical protein LTR17_025940 [Elasticomyces elasticus]|nr:hypothetical protein LTR17_025940 [Elasticomyces elasticus]
MILVCSSRSAAESLNFQKACCNIIVMDIVNNNTILQIIGRCYRIGQTHEQFIKVLTLNRTYDQHIVSNYAATMISQLAATSGSAHDAITDADCSERMSDDPDFQKLVEDRGKLSGRGPMEEARELIYDDIIHEKFRRNFGIRTDRDNMHWNHQTDPDMKLLLKAEREFFLGKRGLCGLRTKEWLDARGIKDADGKAHLQTPVKNKGILAYESSLLESQKKRNSKEAIEKRETKRRKQTQNKLIKQFNDALVEARKEMSDVVEEDEVDQSRLAELKATIRDLKSKIERLENGLSAVPEEDEDVVMGNHGDIEKPRDSVDPEDDLPNQGHAQVLNKFLMTHDVNFLRRMGNQMKRGDGSFKFKSGKVAVMVDQIMKYWRSAIGRMTQAQLTEDMEAPEPAMPEDMAHAWSYAKSSGSKKTGSGSKKTGSGSKAAGNKSAENVDNSDDDESEVRSSEE